MARHEDQWSGRSISHYSIVEKLGEGGMGAVYRARDTRLNRAVAIKLLSGPNVENADKRRRFAQEARAASALNHPNIVTIYDVGEVEGAAYIAMEFVPGKTLHQLLGGKPLPVAEVLQYSAQAADALAAAHAAGIVHRDLKPGNIMITPKGMVKVLDFGIAKLIEPEAESEATQSLEIGPMTGEGVALGTLAYMSPEQAEGKAIDARSDIFSFGAVLYEMLTGRRPFQGGSQASTLSAILTKEPPPLSETAEGIPREIERLIGRCLRKDPERRIQSMSDLKLALEDLVEDTRTGQFPGRPRTVSLPAARRASRRIALLAVGAVALALAARVVWRSFRPAPPVEAPVLTRITSDAGLSAWPALSPDGKLLAYASDRAGGNLDLWLQQVGGGDPIRLTADPADDYEPAFSPDGTRIVFRSERDGGGLYAMAAFGGPASLMARHGRQPAFSPDGSRLAYFVGGHFGKLFLMDAGGGTPRPIRAEFYNARFPIWHPGGKHLLFEGVQKSEAADWWVTALDGSPPTRVGAQAVFRSHKLAAGPGTRAFVPVAWHGGAVVFGARLGDTTNLWTLPISSSWQPAGTPRRITMGTGLEAAASLDSAGRMAFASLNLNVDLWNLALDPVRGLPLGEPQRLTQDAAPDTQPSLSHDGKRLAFVSQRTGNSDIWVKDLATGREVAVTSTVNNERYPVLSGDGTRVFMSASDGEKLTRILSVTLGPGLEPGESQTLCNDCNGISGVSSDGRRVLYGVYPPARTALLDLASGSRAEVLSHPQNHVWGGRPSPDDRWLLFQVTTSPVRSRIYIAPFQARRIPPEEWIAVTDGQGWDDKPRWSADGRAIYFLSERDGFRCLWVQRLNDSKQPQGAPAPFYHFHRARLSMMNVDLGPLGIAVTRDRMVFTLGELTGNLWMAR